MMSEEGHRVPSAPDKYADEHLIDCASPGRSLARKMREGRATNRKAWPSWR